MRAVARERERARKLPFTLRVDVLESLTLVVSSRSASLPGGDVQRNPGLPNSGDLIDRKYCILGRLGAGGMGVVYEAINTSTDKHVALKFLNAELSRSPEAAERFKREAKATGRIHHPNVVAVHDSGHHEGRLYLVMELLKGVVLREWMAKRRVDLPMACRILFPAMRGVAAAHAAGVLHRDLKPDNIFLAESPDGLDPVPKVLDFGLAKLSSGADGGTQLSVVGTAMGTFEFMSPEQLRSQDELDARTDVYAMGAVLFQMLAGRPPYQADNPVDLAIQVVASEAPPISMHASVPPGSVAVIGRALARNRDARFGSIEEFAVALEPYSDGVWFRGTGAHPRVPSAQQAPGLGVTEQFNVRPLGTPFRPSAITPAKRPRSVLPIVAAAVAGLGGLLFIGRAALKLGAAESAIVAPLQSRDRAPAAIDPPELPRPAPSSAPALRPQAPATQADTDGITFIEEPAAPNADWGVAQETWPSPLPEKRAEPSSSSRRELRSLTEVGARDARRRGQHRRSDEIEPFVSASSAAPSQPVTPVAAPPPPEPTPSPAAPPARARRGGTLRAEDF
jgi:eukaryotic-like serine/threonine-protein kinase